MSVNRRVLASVLLVIGLVGGVLASVAVPEAGATPPLGGVFYPVAPARVLDTRVAGQGPCVAGGESRSVPVVGRAGVPEDAATVVLNVTVVSPTANGYLTVYPVGTDRPTASNINFVAGVNVANSVTTVAGLAGQVAIFVSGGCADVLVDVVGFHLASNVLGPGQFFGIPPIRRADTRQPGQTPCIAGGSSRNVTVTGLGGVPVDAATVSLNVTVVNPTTSGYLTVYPTGTARPLASTLNFVSGEVRANAATIRVGTAGQISVFVNNGCADVVVDVVGYTVNPGGGPDAGGFTGVTPNRLLDTRSAAPCVGSTPRLLTVSPTTPVPAGAASVTLNVTVTGPTAPGYLTLYPAGSVRPTVSNVNFAAGQTIANAATVKIGALGQIAIYVNAGCANVLVDVVGYTSTAPTVAVSSNFAGNTRSIDGPPSVARLAGAIGVARDSFGNLYVADSLGHTIRKVSPTGVMSTFAGSPGEADCVNGTGRDVRFIFPESIAVDGSGNVYVGDGCEVIRKITPAGVVTTLAGTFGVAGAVDGTGSAARFSGQIRAIAIDGAGTLYVSDNATIRKVTSAGVVTTLAGVAGSTGSTNGTGSVARFNFPAGIAVEPSGSLLVTDNANFTVRRVTQAGVVTTVAGAPGVGGYLNGLGPSARFAYLRGIATDSAGNAYFSDGDSHVRKLTPGGSVSTVAGQSTGFVDGVGGDARFSFIEGVTSDATGNLTVVDQRDDNGRGAMALRSVTSAGAVTTLLGRRQPLGPQDGPSPTAQFAQPSALCLDPSGNVWVADKDNFIIRRISPAGVVTTVAGSYGASSYADGTGAAARFQLPTGIACDIFGNAFVVDDGSSTIRKVTSAGVVTTFAGDPNAVGSVDGTGAAARFRYPTKIAIDKFNNLFVTDSGNNTVRKITPLAVVTTLAGGAGSTGTTDATGTAARFNYPTGIAVDDLGNVFVGDETNATIRKITSAGVVTTLAGLAGNSGSVDGTGSAARFYSPRGLAVDGFGNVLVADLYNPVIRKVTQAGVVTTVIGAACSFPTCSASGSAAVARFADPSAILVMPSGSFLVADSLNNAIRSVTFIPS